MSSVESKQTTDLIGDTPGDTFSVSNVLSRASISASDPFLIVDAVNTALSPPEGLPLDTNMPVDPPTASDTTAAVVEIERLSPPIEVWDGIQNNNNIGFKNWLTVTDKKANLEAKHPQYNCPLLYHSSRSNNFEVTKILLEKKAKMNSQESPFRSTALHIASFLGHTALTKYLLENKANPYLRNRNGETSIENGKDGKNGKEIMPIYQTYFQDHPMEILDSNSNSDNVISLSSLEDASNSFSSSSSKDSTSSFPLSTIPMLLEVPRIPILSPDHFPQDPESLWQLGICYANGSHGFPKDFHKAYQLFQEGATHGHVNALNSLGYCYFNGEGVEKDYKEAVRLYRLAALKGNVFASYNLGTLYKNGKIIPKNLTSAFEYYKIAADQGHANAQYNIGHFYYSGTGCEPNRSEAIRYWKLADLQGEKKSKKALAALATATVSQQIKQVQEWTIDELIHWFQVNGITQVNLTLLQDTFVDGEKFLKWREEDIRYYGITDQIEFRIVKQFLEAKTLAESHENIRRWGIEDVIHLLKHKGLDQWSQKFRDANIDGKTLLRYTKNDFLNLLLPLDVIRTIQTLLGKEEEIVPPQESIISPAPGITLTNGHKLEIDLNTVSLTVLFQIFHVHERCDPCQLTLNTFLTLYRQCKTCNPYYTSFPSSPSLALPYSNYFDQFSSVAESKLSPILPPEAKTFPMTSIPSMISSAPKINSKERMQLNHKLSSSLPASSSSSLTDTNCVTNFQNLSLHDAKKQQQLLQQEIEHWSSDDVGKWLVRQQLGAFAPLFRERKIDGKAFLRLCDGDLQQMNFKQQQIRKVRIFVNSILQANKKKKNKKPEAFTEFISSLPTKNWKDRLFIGIQIGKGIFHYHENDKIHGNICASNILLKKDKWYLVKDKEKIIIEPEWTAPELILVRNQSSPQADIFSFAFILYSLWNAEIPWAELSRKNICDHICLGARPEFSNSIPAPDEYKELIEKCWHQESRNRPTIDFVLKELKAMYANIPSRIGSFIGRQQSPTRFRKISNC